MLSSGSNDEFDQLLHNAQMDRIAPAGQVRTSASAVVDVADATPAAPRSGAELANASCASCHTAGVAGAPKFDDKAEWDKRATAGLEALVASVVNGKGGMPAGGGSDYDEAEITRAVAYMTGLGDGGAVPLPGTEAAAEIQAEETQAAEATAEATAEANSESSEASTTEAVVAVAPSAGVLAALTPRIETTVDQGVCAGCHLNGVANSPKYDDTEEWAKRAEKGYAALAQTVASGKGAMPPRGGSDLTDDELLIAVEYIVQKSL